MKDIDVKKCSTHLVVAFIILLMAATIFSIIVSLSGPNPIPQYTMLNGSVSATEGIVYSVGLFISMITVVEFRAKQSIQINSDEKIIGV